MSISGRPPAASTMRAAAEAIALSALSTDSASVSSSSASPKQPCTVSTGEPGAYVDPSAYPLMSNDSDRPSSQRQAAGLRKSRAASSAESYRRSGSRVASRP